MIPSQKPGIDIPKNAVLMLRRSSHEFCCTAEITPMGRATIKLNNKAPAASSIVAGKRSAINDVTGCLRT